MSKLITVKPVPFIDEEVVKKGVTGAYVLETNRSDEFNGIVSEVKAEEVTLSGISKGDFANLRLSAVRLKANKFEAFKYTQNQAAAGAAWTKDVETEMIDPDVCKPGYFIMYRQNENVEYENGLIMTVERDKMTVSLKRNYRNEVVTLTLEEMKKTGFGAEVSPVLLDTFNGENVAVVKNARVGGAEIENKEQLWFNT